MKASALALLIAEVSATASRCRGPTCDNGMIYGAAFSSKLPVIAVAGRRGGTFDGFLKLYDVRTGKLCAAKLWPEDHRGYFISLDFAPDGTTIAAADGAGSIALWSIRSEDQESRFALTEPRAFYLPAKANALRFSPDGGRLAAGCGDGVIRILDAKSGTALAEVATHAPTVTALTFSPQGEWLAAAGGADGKVYLIDTNTFAVVRTFQRGTAVVSDVAFAGPHRLVAAYRPGLSFYASERSVNLEYPREQVRVWNLSSGELEKPLFVGGNGAFSIDVSPVAHLVAAGCTHGAGGGDDAVAILDSGSFRRLTTIRPQLSAPGCRWAPREALLVVTTGHFVELWDLTDPRTPQQVWHAQWSWTDEPTE